MSEQDTPQVRRPRPGLRADLVAAGLAVVVAVVFWTQRSYREPLSGVFPDFVLAGLVVLAVLLVLRTVVFGVARRAGVGEPAAQSAAAEAESGLGASAPVGAVFASMAFLAGWVALLTPLGFNLSGILGFLAVTVFLRRGSFRLRHLLVDVPVAVAVVWLCFLVFTRVLLVPLPVPPFLYG